MVRCIGDSDNSPKASDMDSGGESQLLGWQIRKQTSKWHHLSIRFNSSFCEALQSWGTLAHRVGSATHYKKYVD